MRLSWDKIEGGPGWVRGFQGTGSGIAEVGRRWGPKDSPPQQDGAGGGFSMGRRPSASRRAAPGTHSMGGSPYSDHRRPGGGWGGSKGESRPLCDQVPGLSLGRMPVARRAQGPASTSFSPRKSCLCLAQDETGCTTEQSWRVLLRVSRSSRPSVCPPHPSLALRPATLGLGLPPAAPWGSRALSAGGPTSQHPGT